MNTFTSKNTEDTKEFAKKILHIINSHNPQIHIISLSGDLGAGKTTFTQEIGTLLNINKHITSPTYTIFKIYSTKDNSQFQSLCHIDAYRLQSAEDIINLGITDYLDDPRVLTIIEWPEKITDLIQKYNRQILKIKIQLLDHETERLFYYSLPE